MKAPKEVFDKIKDEGHELAGNEDAQLHDRCHRSAAHRFSRNETCERLDARHARSWGLQNAHLESWGPFGRGWTLKRFSRNGRWPDGLSADLLSESLVAGNRYANSGLRWSIRKRRKAKHLLRPAPQSTAFTGEVVRFTATKAEDLEQYKGKLKGKIVLDRADPRGEGLDSTAEGKRDTENELLDLADAPNPNAPRPADGSGGRAVGLPANFAQMQQFNAQRMRFLSSEEGAAIL